MTRRVLITGGAGFAGHHLIEHLLAVTDWELVVLDGLTYAGRPDRLTDCQGYDPGRVTLLWHDLRAPVHHWLDDRIGDVDAVLHLAAESHVDRSIASPGPFIHNNVAATVNLLEWARTRTSITHFVQVSTDEVYGPAEEGTAHAEWAPVLPSNPYSASKACQEAVAFSYWRTYGLPVVVVNIMNMFGERQHPEKFIPLAIRSVLAGDEVPLHGRRRHAGISTPVTLSDWWEPSSRCWLHARNFADALRWVLTERRPTVFGDADRPDRWHVAGEEFSVLSVAHRIAQAAGKDLRYAFTDYHSSRPGHDHRYALDASKIAAAGWKAPVPFAESLERTVHWFMAHKEWLR